MYSKKLFALFMLLVFSLQAQAADKLLGAIGKQYSYDIVDGDDKPLKLRVLLNKSSISYENRFRAMDLCLQSPHICKTLDIFSKVSVNAMVNDFDTFVFRLYLLSIDDNTPFAADAVELLHQAFTKPELALHWPMPGKVDLAFLILRHEGHPLIADLFMHRNFDPNHRYGAKKLPLMTRLIKHESYSSVRALLAHKNFYGGTVDRDKLLPANYLLQSHSKLAHQHMWNFFGDDVSRWPVHGLGLYKINNLKNLFENVLQNNNDRLIILEKIIRASCVGPEAKHHRRERGVGSVFYHLLFDDLLNMRKPWINEDFDRRAVEMLERYEVMMPTNDEHNLHL